MATTPAQPDGHYGHLVDPEDLSCPGCGETVSWEPPAYDVPTTGGELAGFSHSDGSPLCGQTHHGPMLEPIEAAR